VRGWIVPFFLTSPLHVGFFTAALLKNNSPHENIGLIELVGFSDTDRPVSEWFNETDTTYDVLMCDGTRSMRRNTVERTYDLEALSRSYLYSLSSSFAQTLQLGKGLNIASCVLVQIQLVDASKIDLDDFETPQARAYIQKERSSEPSR
jgi:hypothetical protein